MGTWDKAMLWPCSKMLALRKAHGLIVEHSAEGLSRVQRASLQTYILCTAERLGRESTLLCTCHCFDWGEGAELRLQPRRALQLLRRVMNACLHVVKPLAANVLVSVHL